MEDVGEERKGAEQEAGDKTVVSAQPQSVWSLSHYTDISSLPHWTVISKGPPVYDSLRLWTKY